MILECKFGTVYSLKGKKKGKKKKKKRNFKHIIVEGRG
jgi:hypothetical protein